MVRISKLRALGIYNMATWAFPTIRGPKIDNNNRAFAIGTFMKRSPPFMGKQVRSALSLPYINPKPFKGALIYRNRHMILCDPANSKPALYRPKTGIPNSLTGALQL